MDTRIRKDEGSIADNEDMEVRIPDLFYKWPLVLYIRRCHSDYSNYALK